jgi:hypothetical protein
MHVSTRYIQVQELMDAGNTIEQLPPLPGGVRAHSSNIHGVMG